MINYIIALILLASPCYAGMGVGVFPQPGPGVMAVDSGGGVVLVASQLLTDTAADVLGYTVGQEFTPLINTQSTITVHLYFETAGTTCEVRVASNSWDLSTTYLSSTTFVPSVGWVEKTLPTGTLQANNSYMMAIHCDGGSVQRSATNVYSGGAYRFRLGENWNLTTTAERDLTFKVYTP